MGTAGRVSRRLPVMHLGGADNAPVAELARVPTDRYRALNSGEFSY
jgi:hypothetical protein